VSKKPPIVKKRHKPKGFEKSLPLEGKVAKIFDFDGGRENYPAVRG
jgi:hypothetical protein